MRRLLILGASLIAASVAIADGDDSKKVTVEVAPAKRAVKRATPTAFLPVPIERSRAMLCGLKQSENLGKWLNEVVNLALASQRVINKEDVFVSFIDLCPEALSWGGDSPGPVMASVHGDEMQFASGFSRLIYAVAAYNHLVKSCADMDPALQSDIVRMLRDGDDTSTNKIVDFLSGTGSGPALGQVELCDFASRRDFANLYLTNLGFQDFNVNQKIAQQAPGGTELQLLGGKLPLNYENSNRLTAKQVAGLFYLLDQEALVSPGASHAMKAYMFRPVEQQKLRALSGIAAGLPVGSKLVSLNGYSVRNYHDAGIVTLPSGQRYILSVMTKYNDYPTVFIPILSRFIAFRMQTSTGTEDPDQYLYIPPLASK
ncbi:MAG: serine hydrolase [Candidatus Sumerlaeaceae bacterium]